MATEGDQGPVFEPTEEEKALIQAQCEVGQAFGAFFVGAFDWFQAVSDKQLLKTILEASANQEPE